MFMTSLRESENTTYDLKTFLRLNDVTLMKLTAHTAVSKIHGIHGYFKQHGVLTSKQRYALALWVHNHVANYAMIDDILNAIHDPNCQRTKH
jgi:hypothetical protein